MWAPGVRWYGFHKSGKIYIYILFQSKAEVSLKCVSKCKIIIRSKHIFVCLTHTVPANLVLRRCDRFGQHQGHTCTQSHYFAESFQSTLVRKKGSRKKIQISWKMDLCFSLLQYVLNLTNPFSSGSISAGVSLTESDSANLNLENNSLISFK